MSDVIVLTDPQVVQPFAHGAMLIRDLLKVLVEARLQWYECRQGRKIVFCSTKYSQVTIALQQICTLKKSRALFSNVVCCEPSHWQSAIFIMGFEGPEILDLASITFFPNSDELHCCHAIGSLDNRMNK